MTTQEMHNDIKQIMQANEPAVAEQATGCDGAGDYREWARQQGYPHLLVWDWTSSAGDWTFLVSTDREVWLWMFQENNFPRPGFTRSVNNNENSWDYIAASFDEPQMDDDEVYKQAAFNEGIEYENC